MSTTPPVPPVIGEVAVKQSGRLARFLKGSAKWGAIAAGIGAVVGGVTWWMSSKRKDTENESALELHQKAMESVSPVSGNTLMGMEPVLNGPHAARVLAGRGMGAAQGVDASQPNLTVGGPVQQLGA